MKNRSSKNEENHHVTLSEKYKDVGIGFVRLSGTVSVSIVSYFHKIVGKNAFLKKKILDQKVKLGNARCIYVLNQNLGNLLFFTPSKNYNVLLLRHSRKINKQKRSSSNFSKRTSKKEFKFNDFNLKKGCNRFNTIKTKLINHGKKEQLILLKCGDIERNPGPVNCQKSISMQVITYNVRGLKEYSKLKRVLNSCAKIIKDNRNSIICLQETHLDRGDENKLRVMWKENYVISPGAGKSRGCITLFDNSWEKISSKGDPSGRFTVINVKKNFGTYVITNLYAPNEQSIDFFESIFKHSVEARDRSEAVPIIVGDFNLVIAPEVDSINRTASNREVIVSNFVKDSMLALGLRDSYRVLNKGKGFTWSRGQCFSRLDMVFVHMTLESGISSAELDWAFDRSDHALLRVNITIKAAVVRGPGLPRVDPSILEDESIKREVLDRLRDTVETIPEHWNPNQRWEFLKVNVRSTMWEISARMKKLQNMELEATKEQLNNLKANKEKLCSDQTRDQSLLQSIDEAISHFECTLNREWERKSKTLANKAKVKWFNEGEKSNKYFLNIINKRQSETLLTNLSWDDRSSTSQKEIQNLVVDFYSDLYQERNDLNTDFDSFFSPDTPTLNEEDRTGLDTEISLEEITATLRSCGESAAGPDGITYKTYQALWEVLGPHSLNSWKYSNRLGILPDSQRNSSITLLPKEGKDITQIGNWRPITLTNCDLKIYTKTLANRVALVLHKVVFETQTAYVPGRNVHNNLRMFEFYRDYCNRNNVDAILMSLDAKKAFDSVDHKYMYATLKKYGFSDNFIDTVKMLYRDIKADILVNGYRSVSIKIGRCVKQGDALSCALFILCLDPLIRNIERNKKIKAVSFQTPKSNIKVANKTGAFADDVGVVTKRCDESIREVFMEYRRFSAHSGITLNETKTEILILNRREMNFVPTSFEINLPNSSFTIQSVKSITICGVAFSNYSDVSYQLNVRSKFDKLRKKLLAWQYRGLSLGGKIEVIRTFGISQLIYTMQACEYDNAILKEIEVFIFGFLWSKNLNIAKAPDRIKRNIMKQDYSLGGLRVPDVKVLNSALKLKQYFKASMSHHPIKLMQRYHLELLGYDQVISQEYVKICEIDNVINLGQITLNELTDKWREEVNSVNDINEINGTILDLIASTDVKEYLRRKGALMSACLFDRLRRSGVEHFKQLVIENLFPRNDAFLNLSAIILGEFPTKWGNLIRGNIESNSNLDIRENIIIDRDKSTKISCCTVKEIRNRLVKGVHETPKFERVFGIIAHEGINPFEIARIVNYSTSQRIFKFRLLHLDIFSRQRMFKFKMIDNDKCEVCGEVETIKHAIWECPRARLVWDTFKNMMRAVDTEIRLTFDSLFVGFNPTNIVAETIITKLTQVLLSYDRSTIIGDNALKTLLLSYAFLNTSNKKRRIKNNNFSQICT